MEKEKMSGQERIYIPGYNTVVPLPTRLQYRNKSTLCISKHGRFWGTECPALTG